MALAGLQHLLTSYNHLSAASSTAHTSGETLCRDNCQLIGMSFFYTRSAGKNNRN